MEKVPYRCSEGVLQWEPLEGGMLFVMVDVENNKSFTNFGLGSIVFNKDRITYA